MAASHFNPGVAILAAGASTRMGQPKLLLPWCGTTILGHLVREWTALGANPVAVVTASESNPLLDEMERIGLGPDVRLANPRAGQGMFSSIQCAAGWPGWPSTLTHVVLTLGDQPHVARATLRALLEFAASNPDQVCQPERNGRGRHPVLLPRRLLPELTAGTATTLKEFLTPRQALVRRFPSDDAGLDWDLDEWADYERARRWTGQV